MTITGAVIVVVTEILSALVILNRTAVLSCWLVVAAVVVGLIRGQRHKLVELPGRMRTAWKSGSTNIRVLAVFAILWFAMLLVLAVVAAPNNYDSLAYRLPRVMQWADAQSVEFFPTQILRQNTRPPLAEWGLLHLYLLTGSDRLFALLQWGAFVIVALAAVEIASLLGASRRQRILAWVLVATTPLAILQASSTQNDLVGSAWLLLLVIFAWRLIEARTFGARLIEGVFCGLALGLLVLTKSTLLPAAALVGLFAGGITVVRAGVQALPIGAVTAALALLLAMGHASRNHELSGSFLGPEGETISRLAAPDAEEVFRGVHTNQEMSPRHLISNVSRNLAVQLSGPMEGWNHFLMWLTWRIHEILGLSVEEPATTLPGQKFLLSELRHEDVAGSLPQALLMVITLGMASVQAVRGRLPSSQTFYAAGLVMAFVLLSVALRWEIWHARIFLPLLLAGTPFVAAMLPVDRWPAGLYALGGAVVAYAFPYVMENDRRPAWGEKSVFAVPRGPQFMRGNIEAYSPFHQAVRAIKRGDYKVVGLHTDLDDITYPLWPLISSIGREDVILRQVDPRNLSRRLEDGRPLDAILVTHDGVSEELMVHGTNYVEVWREGNLTLFGKQP